MVDVLGFGKIPNQVIKIVFEVFSGSDFPLRTSLRFLQGKLAFQKRLMEFLYKVVALF